MSIKPFFTTLNQFWGIGYTDERRYPNVSGNITVLIFRVNVFQGYTGTQRNDIGHNGTADHSTLYVITSAPSVTISPHRGNIISSSSEPRPSL